MCPGRASRGGTMVGTLENVRGSSEILRKLTVNPYFRETYPEPIFVRSLGTKSGDIFLYPWTQVSMDRRNEQNVPLCYMRWMYQKSHRNFRSQSLSKPPNKKINKIAWISWNTYRHVFLLVSRWLPTRVF